MASEVMDLINGALIFNLSFLTFHPCEEIYSVNKFSPVHLAEANFIALTSHSDIKFHGELNIVHFIMPDQFSSLLYTSLIRIFETVILIP
jgi:hypothetical protein